MDTAQQPSLFPTEGLYYKSLKVQLPKEEKETSMYFFFFTPKASLEKKS